MVGRGYVATIEAGGRSRQEGEGWGLGRHPYFLDQHWLSSSMVLGGVVKKVRLNQYGG